MTQPRPIPPSAIPPPPGRSPERKFLRLRDGYETSVYVHRPPAGAPEGKLPVLYAHGIQSHPGWFYGSAMALASAGHTVYQLTRRGSGDNPAARGDCPHRAQLLDDVRMNMEFLLAEEKTELVHLLGVSWGGKLLAALLARDETPQRHVKSLTLIAPGIVPRADVQFRVKIRIAGSLLVHPDALYDIPLGDVSLFTDNEPMRRYLADDAFGLHQATARFLFESRRMDQDVHRAKAGSIPCPTTLILSKRDRIIDNAKTRAVVEKLAGEKLNVVELDGSHTLEFEPDPAEFFRHVVEAVERGE
ncbi:MAG: alpha/beta fold hydrolase [Phycisphaerae bacterium]|nr:alpha/beta fold hydrolase [Phycisphaerae bacterium]